jgi:two-component system CheB/CheR fusion protein
MTAQKFRLLLIEDDEIDREAVHRLLEANYFLEDAPTGRQALTMVQNRRPDGILLDYRLPDCDGFQLLSQFASAGIPVVILTGEESPEIIVEAMKQGAQDYLVKDNISRAALDHAMVNAIEKTTLKRDLEEQQQILRQQAARLEEQNKKIRALASELTLAEQRERRRISQILHDDLQQTIYGIQVRKHLINMSLPEQLSPELTEQMEALEVLINRAIDVTRSLTVQLSPPTLKGKELKATFEWLAAQMAEVHQLTVDLEIRDNYQVASEDLHVLIFQLVRELLFNVVKHAGVKQARLATYEREERLFICIQDQGVGFDPTLPLKEWGRGGFGLHSIQERLGLFEGDLQINSTPGEGTEVTISVPKVPHSSSEEEKE